MDSSKFLGEGLEHARWRVQFLWSLIETNRALPFHVPKREDTEAALLAKLADAERELARLTAGTASATSEPPS